MPSDKLIDMVVFSLAGVNTNMTNVHTIMGHISLQASQERSRANSVRLNPGHELVLMELKFIQPTPKGKAPLC